MEEQQWEKSKKRSMVDYWAIIDHFHSTTPYKKNDA
jgi:hypothetical protein